MNKPLNNPVHPLKPVKSILRKPARYGLIHIKQPAVDAATIAAQPKLTTIHRPHV